MGHLDVGGVEHDADGSAEGLGGEVVAELSTDNAGVSCRTGSVAESFCAFRFACRSCLNAHREISRSISHTVWPGDLAPDNPDVGTPNLTLGPVDESNLLAEVEAVEKKKRHVLAARSPSKYRIPYHPGFHSLGGLGVVNTVDLDQTVFIVRSFVSRSSKAGRAYRYLVLGLTARLERW